MSDELKRSYSVFDGHRVVARGALAEAAQAQQAALECGATGPVLIFDDISGRQTDADPRWLALTGPMAPDEAPTRGRGRPRLGVVAREVTLLPRQWTWLAAQPGGASSTLRRLVDAARRDGVRQEEARTRREAAYAFISAIGGNLPGFDEAARALFAGDSPEFESRMAAWPADVRTYAVQLLNRDPEADDAT